MELEFRGHKIHFASSKNHLNFHLSWIKEKCSSKGTVQISFITLSGLVCASLVFVSVWCVEKLRLDRWLSARLHTLRASPHRSQEVKLKSRLLFSLWHYLSSALCGHACLLPWHCSLWISVCDKGTEAACWPLSRVCWKQILEEINDMQAAAQLTVCTGAITDGTSDSVSSQSHYLT